MSMRWSLIALAALAFAGCHVDDCGPNHPTGPCSTPCGQYSCAPNTYCCADDLGDCCPNGYTCEIDNAGGWCDGADYDPTDPMMLRRPRMRRLHHQ